MGVSFLDGIPITAKLPMTLTLTVESSPDTINSGTNPTAKGISYKTVSLPNGLRAEVPEFVQTGEQIEMHLDDNMNLTYSKRIRS